MSHAWLQSYRPFLLQKPQGPYSSSVLTSLWSSPFLVRFFVYVTMWQLLFCKPERLSHSIFLDGACCLVYEFSLLAFSYSPVCEMNVTIFRVYAIKCMRSTDFISVYILWSKRVVGSEARTNVNTKGKSGQPVGCEVGQTCKAARHRMVTHPTTELFLPMVNADCRVIVPSCYRNNRSWMDLGLV